MHRHAHAATREAVARLERAIGRLQSEVKQALKAAGLGSSATWKMLVAELPALDRGTADRLRRFARWHDDMLAAIEIMPGPRAWHKIILAVEDRVGESEPQAARLRAAVDDFATAIHGLGGSFEHAKRVLREPRPGAIEPHLADARQDWFEAAAGSMGYAVDCRVDATMLRVNPEKPERADYALLQSYLGARGRPGCSPFVLAYQASGGQADGARPDVQDLSTRVLSSGTSSPPPDILFSSEDQAGIAIIQGDWPTRYDALDLTVMRLAADAENVAWAGADRVERGHTVITHPTRRLVIEKYLSHAYFRHAEIEFAATRMRGPFGYGDRWVPWYDRLEERATIQRFEHAADMPAPQGCDCYRPMMDEAFQKAGWDVGDLIPFRIEIEYPVPFANYIVAFHY